MPTSTVNRVILHAEPLRCDTLPTVTKVMVLQNTFGYEVAAPTVKRGFVMPKFRGSVQQHPPMVAGKMGLSVRLAARRIPCFEHLAHPLRFKTQTVVSKSRYGALTMPKLALVRPAAPITLSTTDANPEAIHLHMAAVNGLAAALHILRNSDMDRADLSQAIGKALRGTTALKRLAQEVAA